MQKKYIVRLSKEERNTLQEVVKKLKGSSQKVRRAQILLKADADGPAEKPFRESGQNRQRAAITPQHKSDPQ